MSTFVTVTPRKPICIYCRKTFEGTRSHKVCPECRKKNAHESFDRWRARKRHEAAVAKAHAAEAARRKISDAEKAAAARRKKAVLARQRERYYCESVNRAVALAECPYAAGRIKMPDGGRVPDFGLGF